MKQCIESAAMHQCIQGTFDRRSAPAGDNQKSFDCVSGTNEYIVSAATQQYIDFGIME
jgi:hypothetical protein